MATTYVRELWTVRGSDTLLRARLVVQTAYTHSATNFWTFTLRRRKVAIGLTVPAQSIGEQVGSALSTETRDLAANVPATIYDDLTGLPMSDGETLVLYAVSTGSPAALDDPRVRLKIQRKVS